MRRIKENDVIAVAVTGVKCPPVGLVVEADDDAILIDLYSWLTRHFSAGQMVIRRRDIRATMWAAEMSESAIEAAGINRNEGETVFDMDTLGDFQRAWKVE